MVLTVSLGAITYGIVSASNGGTSAANKELAAALRDYTSNKDIAEASPNVIADFIQHSQPQEIPPIYSLAVEETDSIDAGYSPAGHHHLEGVISKG